MTPTPNQITECDDEKVLCEFHVGVGSGIMYGYGLCGKPAKYKTPKHKEPEKYVCGIHARSVNTLHQRMKTGLVCVPINDGKSP